MNFWYEEIDVDSILTEGQIFDSYDISLLQASISDIGMIYEPVVELKNGNYVIRDGFQRLEVAKKLGYKKIRCKVYAGMPRLSAKLIIDPNIARRHLTEKQIQDYKAKREELINKLQQQVIESSEIVLENDDIEYLNNIPPSKMEKIFASVEKKVKEKYEQLIAEKEKEIEELKAKQVDIEELKKDIRKKLAEKEIELRKQIQEELQQGITTESAEVKKLKAEIETYEKDIEEMNNNLAEMSRIINSLKKEKETYEDEKNKILEEKDFYKKLAQKYQSEINGLRELEIKKLQSRLKQQESIVNSLVRPDAILQAVSVARTFLSSATEQLTRIYSAIDENMKNQLMQELKQVRDMVDLIEEIVEKSSQETEKKE